MHSRATQADARCRIASLVQAIVMVAALNVRPHCRTRVHAHAPDGECKETLERGSERRTECTRVLD
eukprot:3573145-Pleurochrysis_carterae.AAC.1